MYKQVYSGTFQSGRLTASEALESARGLAKALSVLQLYTAGDTSHLFPAPGQAQDHIVLLAENNSTESWVEACEMEFSQDESRPTKRNKMFVLQPMTFYPCGHITYGLQRYQTALPCNVYPSMS